MPKLTCVSVRSGEIAGKAQFRLPQQLTSVNANMAKLEGKHNSDAKPNLCECEQ